MELALTGKGISRSGPRRCHMARQRVARTRAGRRAGHHAPRVESAGSRHSAIFSVPDSAGALALPAVHYPYYDLAAGRYRRWRCRPRPWRWCAVANPPPPPRSRRGCSTGASRRSRGGWATRFPTGCGCCSSCPAAARDAAGRRTLPRLRRPAAAARSRSSRRGGGAGCSWSGVLVPDAERGSERFTGRGDPCRGSRCRARRAGRPSRDRLLARRYGPESVIGEDAALTAEVREIGAPAGRRCEAWRCGQRGRAAGSSPLGATLQAQTPRRSASTIRDRCARRRMGSPDGPTASLPWRRNGTISAPPTTGWAQGPSRGGVARGSPARSTRVRRPPRARADASGRSHLRSLDLVASGHARKSCFSSVARAGSWLGSAGLCARGSGTAGRSCSSSRLCDHRGPRPPCLVSASDRDRGGPPHAPALSPRARAGDCTGRGRKRGAAAAASAGVGSGARRRAREGWVPDDAVAAVGG